MAFKLLQGFDAIQDIGASGRALTGFAHAGSCVRETAIGLGWPRERIALGQERRRQGRPLGTTQTPAFDQEPAQARMHRQPGQRLAEIGGECRIESRSGAGTKVTFELPWLNK